ncbi:MAG: 3-hydroxyacyl-ACP dehydratase FabZ family protein [Planctomycetia bacterium]
MPPRAILETTDIPTAVVLDQEGIRKILPQRFEMEHLTAITLLDSDRHLIAGYKDVRDDEFWVRGHLPGYPLLPGVLICEAAAQLSTVYSSYFRIAVADFIGFGGMEDVRFRGVVRPGDRLVLVGHTERHSPRQMVFDIQGFVRDVMVFNGRIIGIPMQLKN